MARSNSSRKPSNTTRRTTTTAPKQEETTVSAPETPEEQQVAESPTDPTENAAQADSEASGPEENVGPYPDVEPGETNTPPNEDDTPPENTEEGEAGNDEEPASEQKSVSLNSADAKFTTDRYGNALTPAVPNRATSSVKFYPFKYEAGQEEDTIIAKERVYSVMEFYGTKRKGKALAYPEGTLLNKAILDAVDDDA